MKKLFTLITVAATAITMQAQNVVDVTSASPGDWKGYMNVFDNPNAGGAFLWGSAWGVADIKSEIDSINGTVVLYPNFNNYDSTNAYWTDTVTFEGNKRCEASTYVESDSLFNNQDLTFEGNISSFTIDTSKYEVNLFVKALDPNNGWSDALGGAYIQPVTGTGEFSIMVAGSSLDTGLVVQYGFNVIGLNADPALESQLGNVVVGIVVDSTAPVPVEASLMAVSDPCSVDTLMAPMAVSNAGDTIMGTTMSTFPITATEVVTWTYTDSIGNSFEQNQSVEITGLVSTFTISELTITADDSTVSYQWIDCSDNSPISGETNQSFTGTAGNSYAVIVSSGNCSDTSSCVTLAAGIANNLNDQISVYPNPTNGMVNIDFGQINNASVEVFNAFGQVIMSRDEVSTNFQFELNERAGIYFVKVRATDGRVGNFKVVKQ